MGRTRHLLSHINLINILMTGILIFLVNYMLLPFFNKSILYSPPAAVKHEKTEPLADKKQDQSKTPSPLEYIVIAEQNLFHPERKIPVEVKEAQPLPKPDFVLYGTLISGDTNAAYMEDKKSPVNSPGRGKRQTTLKLGESMSGFTLKELSEDRVIMARGEERLTVYLIDPKKPKERVVAAPASTTIAQGNQTGAKAPPPQTVDPNAPNKRKTADKSSEKTSPKMPSAEARDANRQNFLDIFKRGMKR